MPEDSKLNKILAEVKSVFTAIGARVETYEDAVALYLISNSRENERKDTEYPIFISEDYRLPVEKEMLLRECTNIGGKYCLVVLKPSNNKNLATSLYRKPNEKYTARRTEINKWYSPITP